MRALAATALLALAVARCQEPRISTTVHLVVAPTTVVDRGGRFVDGLTEKDFVLLDNGARRDIRVDYTYVPISLVIAVETSEHAAEAVNKVRKAGSLVEPLVVGERGEVALVAFDDEVRVVRDFTSDFASLTGAIKRLETGGRGSRLVDAVNESVRLLTTRPDTRRRVLLMIGEARDRSSQTKLEDAVTYAQRENVAVYSVTYSVHTIPFTAKPGTPAPGGGLDLLAIFREIAQLAKTNAADALSRYSGGTRYSFTRQRALEHAISRIGEELHSQYLLSFTVPEESKAEFHAIEVKLPGHPGAVVRTRPGYWLAAP